jgi:hypothetical protein
VAAIVAVPEKRPRAGSVPLISQTPEKSCGPLGDVGTVGVVPLVVGAVLVPPKYEPDEDPLVQPDTTAARLSEPASATFLPSMAASESEGRAAPNP